MNCYIIRDQFTQIILDNLDDIDCFIVIRASYITIKHLKQFNKPIYTPIDYFSIYKKANIIDPYKQIDRNNFIIRNCDAKSNKVFIMNKDITVSLFTWDDYFTSNWRYIIALNTDIKLLPKHKAVIYKL